MSVQLLNLENDNIEIHSRLFEKENASNYLQFIQASTPFLNVLNGD
jgi:hypothetical protein